MRITLALLLFAAVTLPLASNGLTRASGTALLGLGGGGAQSAATTDAPSTSTAPPARPLAPLPEPQTRLVADNGPDGPEARAGRDGIPAAWTEPRVVARFTVTLRERDDPGVAGRAVPVELVCALDPAGNRGCKLRRAMVAPEEAALDDAGTAPETGAAALEKPDKDLPAMPAALDQGDPSA